MKQKSKRLVPLLLDWFSANARDLPWRKTRDAYAIWVSEIMLQQTQVKTVMPYWERWMRELPTIESVAKASPDKIHKLWEGLGYYTRARNLQKAAQLIMHAHEGKFPKTFEEVLALPGIGRYTAGAICSIAFNQPTPILDGNVIRVLTRVFGIAENPKNKETNQLLWKIAGQLVSHVKTQRRKGKKTKSFASSAPLREDNSCSFLNQSLMELGALICTPRNPQCKSCPVKKHCVAFKENRIEQLPNLEKREAATARHFVAFVVERNGKFLVRQRPAGIVNAHLWEFPNYEINGAPSSLPSPPMGEKVARGRLRGKRAATSDSSFEVESVFRKLFAVEVTHLQPLRTVKHSITRYRITLQAFHARSRKSSKQFHGKWLLPSEFDSLAFTAAHKKLASFAANCMLSRS